ncbi:hypothetical protein AWRI3579_g3205 [Hanseniaspora osmophila]|uniref:Uncharacterized protein n=1 Tax=Hanseniaspora osmophila TaxID=56408 RepID=A0A1E5R7H0_9ASCO|nr:hypothetical protein AWRI3579_g3205 [Hanseniaspora osmophila]
MENKEDSATAPIPAHLSEFVDILKNNKLRKSTSTVFNSADTEGGNASASPALLSFGSRNFSFSGHSPQQRRSSQSYAGSMTSSLYQFQTIISKKDIDNTKKDIKALQTEFQKFAKQLDEMTKTASNIGAVLENLSNNSKSEDDEMLLNLISMLWVLPHVRNSSTGAQPNDQTSIFETLGTPHVSNNAQI